MPVLKILQYPDPVLREKSHDIESIREEERALINDLIDTMRSSKGVGLAAVQVGVLKRIVAVDRTPENPGHGLIVLANPVITESSGLKTVREGCLSIPQYLADIKRKERITVRGLDFRGEPVAIESSGLLSVALQHEIDHLDGVLFIDRIEGVRGLLKRKVRGKN